MKPLTVLMVLSLFLGVATAQAERMTVRSSIANIRSGPGTNYDVIWNVEKNHPLFILEKDGAWYRFRDFEGDEGWIHKSLLGDTPAVITDKPECNVRNGPGTNHEIRFTVEKGIPFKLIEREGNWLHVEHADGDRGWIHDSLVW